MTNIRTSGVPPQFSGLPRPQPVVVSAVPYPQGYYPNYAMQNPPAQLLNGQAPSVNQKPTVLNSQFESYAKNQMNSLNKLIEKAEKEKDQNVNSISPFEVRWGYVSDPFPSFWNYDKEKFFNIQANPIFDTKIQNEPMPPQHFIKSNEPRMQPMISNQVQPQVNFMPPTQRSQSPRVSVVATNFIPQRQPSPEIIISNIPPNNMYMSKSMNSMPNNNPNMYNSMSQNNYRISPPISDYNNVNNQNGSITINGAKYQSNSTSYSGHNSYNNHYKQPRYNNQSNEGYGDYHHYNSGNMNNSKQIPKSNNRKQNPNKKRRFGNNQWTYKPDE